MELTPNVDESAIINDTIEQLDTWNKPRRNSRCNKIIKMFFENQISS